MYRPTYECPPKAPKNVVKQVSKLSAISKCLDEALTELMDEETQGENSLEHDRDSTATAQDINQNSTEIIDEKFKAHVMDILGETEAGIQWREEESLLKKDDNDNTNSDDAGRSGGDDDTIKREEVKIPEPPAALLEGNLKYYNRLNGQWRIVATNAVLRPRVNIDYSKRNKSRYYCTSLAEQSKIICTERNESRRTGKKDGSRIIDDEFPQNEDGGIPLDGEIVILAYDDIA